MDAFIRLGIALAVFALMMVWEALSPKRLENMHRLQRWPINLGLGGFNTLLLRLTTGSLAISSAVFAQQQGWGLLQQWSFNDVLATAVSLLMLDLAIYGQHVASHRWSLLWRLHQVHHTDLTLDVTSAVRFHPLEILLSLAYKSLCIVALGASPIAVVSFEILLSSASAFNHGNVSLPQRLDNGLRWLIVTPDMHRIHHSTNPKETDSNYGFCLACWDRLFGTYLNQPALSQTTLAIGLPAFRNANELSFSRLLLLPFRALKR